MKDQEKEGIIEKTVTSDGANTRLDRCLRLWISSLPQGLIEKAARKGLIKVDGSITKPSTRVQEGQTIIFPEDFLQLESSPQKNQRKTLTHADRKQIKSYILYEDHDIVVLNKPAGLPVQGGTKQKKAIDTMLEAYYEDCKPRLVHRLDLDTSGILVLAKSVPLARWFTQSFKERKVQKVYWAIVIGVPKKKEGIISLALTKKQGSQSEKIRVDHESGVHATTYYQVLEALGNRVAWLEMVPKTGRTHQLRVHCAEGLKTPILGDGKYGGKEVFSMGRKRLHLHARAITLPFPNGKSKTFEAPLPKDFEETIKGLGFNHV